MIAADVAPHADRLVWAVARESSELVVPFRQTWSDIGLEWPQFGILKQLAPFLRAGVLTDDIAQRRFRYGDRAEVQHALAAVAASGHVERVDDVYRSTDAFEPALAAYDEIVARVARSLWSQAETTGVSRLARRVVEHAPDRFVMTRSYAELPIPKDEGAEMHHHAVGLRYVRNEAHAEAWAHHRLDAAEMVVLTAAWMGDEVDPSTPEVDSLVDRGWLDHASLTESGMDLREAIETETNRRAEEAFAVLNEAEAIALLTGLEALPA